MPNLAHNFAKYQYVIQFLPLYCTICLTDQKLSNSPYMAKKLKWTLNGPNLSLRFLKYETRKRLFHFSIFSYGIFRINVNIDFTNTMFLVKF